MTPEEPRSTLRWLLPASLLLGLLLRTPSFLPGRWIGPDEAHYLGAVAFLRESPAERWADVLPFSGDRPLHLALYWLADLLAGHYARGTVDVLHGLVNGATACMLALLARRWFGVVRPAALLLVAATYPAHASWLYEGESPNSEHLAAAFLAAYLLAWTVAHERGSWAGRAGAAALLGMAWVTKQHLFPLVLLAPALGWVAGVGWTARTFAREMLAAAGAFLAVPLGLLLLFRPSPEVLGGIYRGQLEYVLRPELSLGDRAWRTLSALAGHVLPVPLVALALGGAAVALAARPRPEARERWRPHKLAAVVLLLTLLGLVPGFRFQSHYFQLLLPAAVLVVCGGLVALQGLGLPPRPLAGGLAAGLALLAAWSAPIHLTPLVKRPLAEHRRIAGWLAERTRADERVLVWGLEPQVYLLSRRVPASRMVTTSAVVNDYGGRSDLPPFDPVALALLLRDLERHPPAVFVEPVSPQWGGWDHARYELERVPPLLDHLRRHFAPPETVGAWRVYRRL